MKKVFVLSVLVLALTSCGFEQKDSEAIGQVKKVTHETPLFCQDYKAVDISMGVIRNGVGSMSTQDVWFSILDPTMEKTLKNAAESGKLVKVKYDVRRVAFCTHDHWLTSVEVTE